MMLLPSLLMQPNSCFSYGGVDPAGGDHTPTGQLKELLVSGGSL